MLITQHDVAQVDTTTLKRLAVFYGELAADEATASTLGPFCSMLAGALIRVIRERRQSDLLLEAELMNLDGDGAIVSPGDDPIGDALRELRGDCP